MDRKAISVQELESKYDLSKLLNIDYKFFDDKKYK